MWIQWKPPPPPFLKLNFDAARSAKGSGVAFVLSNKEEYPIMGGQRNIAFSVLNSAMSSNLLELLPCWLSSKEVAKIL